MEVKSYQKSHNFQAEYLQQKGGGGGGGEEDDENDDEEEEEEEEEEEKEKLDIPLVLKKGEMKAESYHPFPIGSNGCQTNGMQ